MNLNTVTALRQPASAAEIIEWRGGYAWLAGGTWLFSEPQLATDTLIDLGQAIFGNATSEEITLLIDSTLVQEAYARNASLQALQVITLSA